MKKRLKTLSFLGLHLISLLLMALTTNLYASVLPTADVGSKKDTTLCMAQQSFHPVNQSPRAAGSTYEWFCISPFANCSLSSDTAYTPTFTPVLDLTNQSSTTSTYVLVETTSGGITSNSKLVIRVLKYSNAEDYITTTRISCIGKPLSLGVQGSPIGNYEWTSIPATNIQGATTTNPIVNPSFNTIYILTYTDYFNGCKTTAQAPISVVAPPKASPISVTGLNAQGFACENTEVMLQVPAAAAQYLWASTLPTNKFTTDSSSFISSVKFKALYDKPYLGNDTNISPTYTAVYTVYIKDNNGCDATNSILLTIGRVPAKGTTEDKLMCDFPGPDIQIGQNKRLSGVNYIWSPASYVSQSLATNPYTNLNNNPAITGGKEYFITLSQAVASNQCVRNDVVKIVISPSLGNAGPDSTLCFGDTIKLGTPSFPGAVVHWTSNLGMNTNAVQPVVVPNQNTTYLRSVEFTLPSGEFCYNLDTLKIYQLNNYRPTITTSAASICEGDSGMLYTLHIPGHVRYNWYSNNNNDTTLVPQLQVKNSDNYSVMIERRGDCASLISAQARIQSLKYVDNAFTDDAPSDSTCDPIKGINLNAVLTGSVYSYQWYADANPIPGAINSTYKVKESGEYSLQVTRSNFCTKALTSHAYTVSQTPEAPTVSATNLCPPASLSIDAADPNNDYGWFYNGVPVPGGGLTIQAQNLGTYVAYAFFEGCSSASKSLVIVNGVIPKLNVDKTRYCAGDDLPVLSTTAVPGAIYYWSRNSQVLTSSSVPSYTIPGGGSYDLEVDNKGCIKKALPVVIAENPLPLVPFVSTRIDGNFIIYRAYKGAGVASFIWSNGITTDSITLDPSQKGNYWVKAVSFDGCESGRYSFTYTSLSSPDVVDFTIYPNPANEYLNISFARQPSANTEIALFTIQGQLVFWQKAMNDLEKIDTSKLPKGIYHLEVYSKEGKASQKVVLH